MRCLILSIGTIYNMKNINITKVTMFLIALAVISAPFDELLMIEVEV